MEEAQDMILTADPLTWILDVRTKFEYQGDMLDDSINVPLLSLRKDLVKLDRNSVYVARSKGDKRCELAAYILNENGFTAYVLNESAEE
jgi:rhodanese-related sulfurtransferase